MSSKGTLLGKFLEHRFPPNEVDKLCTILWLFGMGDSMSQMSLLRPSFSISHR